MIKSDCTNQLLKSVNSNQVQPQAQYIFTCVKLEKQHSVCRKCLFSQVRPIWSNASSENQPKKTQSSVQSVCGDSNHRLKICKLSENQPNQFSLSAVREHQAAVETVRNRNKKALSKCHRFATLLEHSLATGHCSGGSKSCPNSLLLFLFTVANLPKRFGPNPKTLTLFNNSMSAHFDISVLPTLS